MGIIGHQKQLEFLARAKDSGRMGHAFILAGPAMVGKKTAALEWLSGIIGVNLTPQTAHPDFIFVAPLVDPKTDKPVEEITVGQVRELIKRLSLTPSAGKYKAAIIDEAQLMNDEAQNALLKTLEEPPGNALIVLVARNSQRLLETIRSRCEILQFNFVSEHEIECKASDICAKLGVRPEEAAIKEIVKLSFGRPGRMVEFVADKEKINQWRQAEKEFASIIAAELPEKFAYAKKITDDENGDLAQTLEVWQSYLRDKLLESLKGVRPLEESKGSNPLKEKFVFSKLKNREMDAATIAAILKKIQDLSLILQTTNASPKLAIENFMLDI